MSPNSLCQKSDPPIRHLSPSRWIAAESWMFQDPQCHMKYKKIKIKIEYHLIQYKEEAVLIENAHSYLEDEISRKETYIYVCMYESYYSTPHTQIWHLLVDM